MMCPNCGNEIKLETEFTAAEMRKVFGSDAMFASCDSCDTNGIVRNQGILLWEKPVVRLHA